MQRGIFRPMPIVVDEMLPAMLRRHSQLFWFLLFLLAVALATMATSGATDKRAFAGFCIAYGMGFITVPIAFRFSFVIFENWIENIKTFARPDVGQDRKSSAAIVEKWTRKELSFLAPSVPMYIFATLFAGLATIAFFAGDYPIGVFSFPQICALLILLFAAFLAGLGLYGIFGGCRMVWRLGQFRIQVREHKFGVLSTGRVLAQCYFLIAIAWSIYVAGAFVGLNYGNFTLSSAKYPLLLLAIPSLLIALISFVICQIPLHKRMLEFKHNELMLVENCLDDLNMVANVNISQDDRSKIEFYEKKRSQILLLPEWPFKFGTLLAAAGSTATILLPTLLTAGLGAIARAAGLPLH